MSVTRSTPRARSDAGTARSLQKGLQTKAAIVDKLTLLGLAGG